MADYDVVVVGIGGMGSATLYQLARRGLKVLGIEQFGQVAHNMGSSHGLTRIIRLAYYEDPSYVPLLRRAYELWTQIEQETDEQIYYQTGSLDIGTEDSEVFAGSLRSCQQHNLEHEVLTSAQITERFPGYRFPAAYRAVYQPQGGIIVPERAIEAHVQAAQAYGAELHTGERVQGWEPTPNGGVTIRTEAATYTARRLVLCGGAWNYKLLPQLEGVAVPERQVLIWLETKQPEWFTPGAFPVWNAKTEEGRYYGFPEFNPSGETPGMKYGRWHHLDEQVDPDEVDRETHPADETLLRQFGERYFPDGAGRTLDMQVCMFTNTADEHFVIDTLPDTPQVSVAAGFSGHGYKLCSAVGEVMADLAQHGETAHNIELFSLQHHGVEAIS